MRIVGSQGTNHVLFLPKMSPNEKQNSVLHGYGSVIPDFSQPIENITVHVGREAVLECLVSHLGRYKVGWLKAKDQTILALHKRVITHNTRIDVDHEDNRIWKLKIRHVQESDRGCYMCQINTEEMKKQVGCIDVLIPPDIDDLKTSSDVIVNEGDDAHLLCKANGHPKPEIVWLREDKKTFTIHDPHRNATKRHKVSRYTGESLIMRNVQRHQMGAYLCIASNEVPPAVSKRIILNVNFAPEINVPSQLYGVALGTDVTISCEVQAYPNAINYWMKNDAEMLIHGPKYNITEDIKSNGYERIMLLIVKKWEKSDESHFSCMSTNSLGKADGRIQSYTYYKKTQVERNKDSSDDGGTISSSTSMSMIIESGSTIKSSSSSRESKNSNRRKAERQNYKTMDNNGDTDYYESVNQQQQRIDDFGWNSEGFYGSSASSLMTTPKSFLTTLTLLILQQFIPNIICQKTQF
nr:lachesin-like [Lepeophtheirus salmonis]